ncbi:MAG: DUF4350 domain-containing protein [Acidobacteriota bacterium]|nr:DUF4350 domain-containing protein [Acidobacteriota bacterium]
MSSIRNLAQSLAVLFFVLLLISVGSSTQAQQVADTDFKPKIEKPAFAEGKGPVVLLDEAHYNFHTASGRYQSFADLLRRDGYVVNASKEKFSKESLKAGKILVIANALSERNQTNWNPPIDPSFTDDEIKAVREWVAAGGALFLIVDHFPMPQTAGKLAEAFGVRFHNGYALDPRSPTGPLVYKRTDQSLNDHPITRGRTANEKVDSVATFTGSAFQADGGEPVLTFLGSDAFSYTPEAFGQPPDKDSPRVALKGWLQGATINVGKGRVAVFGEAAMFSAQLAGPNKVPMGMNAPIAAQNPQFLLNVMHWLSGKLKK